MKRLIVPTLRDPRYWLLVFFAVLLVYIMSTPGFARSWSQFLLSVSICMTLDFLLTWYLDGRWLLPVSGLISSLGVFVLVDSPMAWPTAAAATLAILSKHLLRVRGQHLFNPTNFGVLIACFAFPDWAISGGHRWGGKIVLTVLLFMVGTMVVIRARRWIVSYSYMGSYFFFNQVRSLIFHKPFWAYSLAFLAPAMQLFIFYMISDPRTSPSDRKRQVVFGIALGLLDNVFRQYQLREASLLSVFLVCGVYNLYRVYRPDLRAFDVWRTREIALR